MKCLGLNFAFSIIFNLNEMGNVDSFQKNLRLTFSRYCKRASAPARTTNVTPNAIPVWRIIRLGVMNNLLCHLKTQKKTWQRRRRRSAITCQDSSMEMERRRLENSGSFVYRYESICAEAKRPMHAFSDRGETYKFSARRNADGDFLHEVRCGTKTDDDVGQFQGQLTRLRHLYSWNERSSVLIRPSILSDRPANFTQ